MITEMRVWMNEDELQTIARATNSNASFVARPKYEIFALGNLETSAGSFPESGEKKFSTLHGHYRRRGEQQYRSEFICVGKRRRGK